MRKCKKCGKNDALFHGECYDCKWEDRPKIWSKEEIEEEVRQEMANKFQKKHKPFKLT